MGVAWAACERRAVGVAAGLIIWPVGVVAAAVARADGECFPEVVAWSPAGAVESRLRWDRNWVVNDSA